MQFMRSFSCFGLRQWKQRVLPSVCDDFDKSHNVLPPFCMLVEWGDGGRDHAQSI